jgi:hypothetical protein
MTRNVAFSHAGCAAHTFYEVLHISALAIPAAVDTICVLKIAKQEPFGVAQ